MIDERSFFFETPRGPLYGVCYGPRISPSGGGRAARPARGVVFCDSLFEEKFWCERVVTSLARDLAGAGHTVLRFDCRGCGNSPGGSADVNPRGLEADAASACDLLAGMGVERIALVGIRWGAAVAARLSAARADVDALFLVQPVASWRPALLQALRANVAGQYSIFKKAVMTREEIVKELVSGGDCVRAGYRMNNVDGYIISREFYEQSETMSLPVDPGAGLKRLLVVQIPEKGPANPAEYASLVDGFKALGAPCEQISIEGDGAFWINNRIFTSTAPRLSATLTEELGRLAEGIGTMPAEAVPQGALETIEQDGVRETCVAFDSADGGPLYGVVYEGAAVARKNAGVIFTHGGLIGMNGAFRFNTRGARRLARRGIPSICFDPHGMGRAGGAIENVDQRVLFRRIQTGLFAEDTERAAAVLRAKVGPVAVAPFGVCGGAITSILAQGRYRDLDASMLLSIPVMLSGLSHEEVRMSEGYARFYLGMYVRKIFNPKAWWRFITFQSEYGAIFKALRVSAAGMLRRIGVARRPSGAKPAPSGAKPAPSAAQPAPAIAACAAGAPRSAGAAGAARSADAPGAAAPTKPALATTSAVTGSSLQFNDAYLAAWRAILARRSPLLFVFGDNDNFKWEFYGEFVEKYPRDFEAGSGLVSIEIVPNANHMYTLREWQDETIDRCMGWLEKQRFNRA